MVARTRRAKSKRRPRRKAIRRQHPRAKTGTGWRITRSNGVRLLESDALSRLPWLVHGFSTRVGGSSRLHGAGALNLGFTDWDTREAVEANRAGFLEALGAARMQLAPLNQIHSDVVHIIDGAPKQTPRGDAAATRSPGVLLAVQTADCIPILLADTRRRAVAAVHAGWRGTLRRIVEKTLGAMRMSFRTRPGDIVAVLGPGIGRCCYEVGPEVAQTFGGQFPNAAEWFDGPFGQLSTGEDRPPFKWLWMTPPGHDPPPPRVHLDLAAANRSQLLDAGVRVENIFSSDLCTACRTDLLFSHRREAGATGRMMAVIGVRA